ncbi:hypothetical protein [Phycicoccus avicenniae]|uniref:hypothetical protein n=1 Tax=Phycicoccus avicenniae TaxID=2828860 RepID=UPI003D2A8F62
MTRASGSTASWVLTWAALPALVVPAVGVLGVLEVLGKPPKGRRGPWLVEAAVLWAPFVLAVAAGLAAALLLARHHDRWKEPSVGAGAGYAAVGFLLGLAVGVPSVVAAFLWVWGRHP